MHPFLPLFLDHPDFNTFSGFNSTRAPRIMQINSALLKKKEKIETRDCVKKSSRPREKSSRNFPALFFLDAQNRRSSNLWSPKITPEEKTRALTSGWWIRKSGADGGGWGSAAETSWRSPTWSQQSSDMSMTGPSSLFPSSWKTWNISPLRKTWICRELSVSLSSLQHLFGSS